MRTILDTKSDFMESWVLTYWIQGKRDTKKAGK